MPLMPRRVETRTHSQQTPDPYDPAVIGPKTEEFTIKRKSGPETVHGYGIDGLIFWDANGDGRFRWRDGDRVSTERFKMVRAGSARLKDTLDKLGLKRASQLKDLWWTSAVDHAQFKRQLALAATQESLAALKSNGCQDLEGELQKKDYVCLLHEVQTLEQALGQFSTDLPEATVTAAAERLGEVKEKLQFKAMVDALDEGKYKEFDAELAKLQLLVQARGFTLPPVLVAGLRNRARMNACLRDAAFSLSEGHLELAVSDLKRAQHYAEKIGLKLNLRQEVIAIVKKELIMLNGDQLRTLFELLR